MRIKDPNNPNRWITVCDKCGTETIFRESLGGIGDLCFTCRRNKEDRVKQYRATRDLTEEEGEI